jgi:PAS domain S-box-containing protein
VPRPRAATSRSLPESVLPSREHGWLRVALVGGPLIALAGAVASLALSPVIGPGLVLAGVLLPAVIVGLLGAAIWRRPFLFAAVVAINLEALAAGAALPDGIAIAVVAPLIGVALVQGSLDAQRLRLVSVAAVLVTGAGVALAVLVGPASVLFVGTATAITIAAFMALVAFALALGWRATTSLRTALDAAQSEISARNAAEAKLERTSTLLSAIVDASPLATQAFTLDRTVTIWNPASERIFGWTADELIGGPMPAAMIPEDERASSAERIQRTIAGETIRGDRVRRLTKDGREVWVEIYGSALRDDAGRPRGLAGQLADVTERVALEAQLAHAERLEAIGRVAGGIAHDFNNTLTAIGGFATLIADEAADPGAVRADSATILDVVDRSRQMTRQLLAFAGRTTLQPTIVDVRTTVSGLLTVLDRLLGGAVRLEVRQPDEALVARVDGGQLEQALINLAVNARDAMQGGGALTVATRRVRIAAGDIADDPAASGQFVAVAVTDTGAGMSADVIGRAFEPFFTTKDVGRGTGLGLAMVRDFMRQSGGHVRLESSPGVGTTVELLLPELVGAQVRDLGDEATPSRPAGSESILVVDDEPAVAAFARRSLADLGYAVCVEHDVRAAIDHLGRCGSIDLLLSAIVLPDGIGTDVADAVREARPGTPTLFVSGYTVDALADRGVRVDSLDVLSKPYTGVELAMRVRQALDGRDPDAPDDPDAGEPTTA